MTRKSKSKGENSKFGRITTRKMTPNICRYFLKLYNKIIRSNIEKLKKGEKENRKVFSKKERKFCKNIKVIKVFIFITVFKFFLNTLSHSFAFSKNCYLPTKYFVISSPI